MLALVLVLATAIVFAAVVMWKAGRYDAVYYRAICFVWAGFSVFQIRVGLRLLPLMVAVASFINARHNVYAGQRGNAVAYYCLAATLLLVTVLALF